MLKNSANCSVPVSQLGTEGTVPGWLTDTGILVDAEPKPYTHGDCRHGCQLQMLKDGEGNVVVECPHDPPCFEGYLRVPPGADHFVCIEPDSLVQQISNANGLRPHGDHTVDGTWYCGSRGFRGGNRLFVYLTGDANPLVVHAVAEHVRYTNHGHGLLVHACRADEATVAAAQRFGIALAELPGGSRWDFKLDLLNAYDGVDPDYLGVRGDNNAFIFEDVTMEFACEPGRHVVRVLGLLHPGFTMSDKNFSRLLLIAAHRKADSDVYDGGWVHREDVGIGEKGKELDELLKALARWKRDDISASDLRLFLRSNPDKDGTVRLALDPANIMVHPSVHDFQPLNRPGDTAHSENPDYCGQQDYDAAMVKTVADASEMVQQALQILSK